MGYTHYWNPTVGFSEEEWDRLCTFATGLVAACKRSGPDICLECDLPDEEPLITKDVIQFNGKEDEGHETFSLRRDEKGFNFCKTARKPYDAAVVAMLIKASEICPTFNSSGDGDNEPGYSADADALIAAVEGLPQAPVRGHKEKPDELCQMVEEKLDELCQMVEAMDRKIQEANNLAITYISDDLREEFNGIVDFVVNHCGD